MKTKLFADEEVMGVIAKERELMLCFLEGRGTDYLGTVPVRVDLTREEAQVFANIACSTFPVSHQVEPGGFYVRVSRGNPTTVAVHSEGSLELFLNLNEAREIAQWYRREVA